APGEVERTALKRDDILIGEGHGNPEEVGRAAVWDDSIRPCLHQNHVIRVRLDRSQAEPQYVSTFLNSASGRRQMMCFGKTTAGLNTISTSNVRNTRILIPPLTIQQGFLAVVGRQATMTSRTRRQMQELEGCF